MAGGRDFLGPYRLIKQLRSGQTCQIWEAVREGETKKVALKLLQDEHKKKKDQVALLKQEVEVGRDLDHRYLIKIYEFDNTQGLPYVAMELFNHKNLKQKMREEPEWIAFNAEKIIRRCAKALGYLHEQGWVHCDVKPDNFLVDNKARIKLLDFAIAQKWKKGGLLSGLLGGSSKNVSGTRSYMSPEQIRGKAVDPRSDIYSLGCLVFELLAGKLPYSGVSGDDLLQKHLRAQIPNACASNNLVSSEMAELIQQMLAKKPGDRPETIDVFLDKFKKLRVYRPGRHPPDPDQNESDQNETDRNESDQNKSEDKS